MGKFKKAKLITIGGAVIAACGAAVSAIGMRKAGYIKGANDALIDIAISGEEGMKMTNSSGKKFIFKAIEDTAE